MIASEQILNQIEKQLYKAKMDSNESSTREALSAIRALCDVVLDSSSTLPPATNPVLATPNINAQSNVLKEDDANGYSLFDF
ncbi:YwdI family protein [Psychrobacillus sp. FJAT-51614]|uniref:YwdI family protein n=1 Tax=Psychrobacillus mangrovi TaxID=3117745 RepID=A0ABU8F1U2_9BACI